MKGKRLATFLAGLTAAIAISTWAQDWFEASGVPAQRSLLNSADLRNEFLAIQNDIADKLPALTGNGDKIVSVNSGGTALTVLSSGVLVSQGGTGSTTAAGARTNLGVAIGSDVQAWDAQLDDIAALTPTDSNFIVGDGANWVAESGATARASLGANDASNLSTGTLPDARLSSNVALLGSQNVFTGAIQTIQNASGGVLRLWDSDDPADTKIWRISAFTHNLQIQTRTDADAIGSVALDIDRTGTTIDSIALASTALTWNGDTLFTTANDGSSSGLDADLLDGSSSGAFAQLANNNIFTKSGTGLNSAAIALSSTVPGIVFDETDASADEGEWKFWSNLGTLRMSVVNDAESVVFDFLSVDRTADVVDSINLAAPADLADGLTLHLGTGSTPASPVLELTNSRPVLVFDEDDAAADNGRWYAQASAEQFDLVAINDANTMSTQFMQVLRTGITIDEIQLDATTFDFNGTMDLSTPLGVASGGTGAATLTGLLEGNGTGAITGGATIDDGDWSGTDLAITNGGTGASDAATALVNLGIDECRLFKTSDESTNTDTMLNDDAELVGCSFATDTYYRVEGDIYIKTNADSSCGFFYNLDLSNAQQDGANSYHFINDDGTVSGDTYNAFETGGQFTTIANNVTDAATLRISGYFWSNASTGGDLAFQWAQAISCGTNTTVLRGSHLIIKSVE